MKKLYTYIKIYIHLFKICIMREITYRANFLVWSVVHTMSLIVDILFFWIIFSRIPVINGWGLHQSLLVVGISHLFAGIGSITYMPIMYSLSQNVRSGNFDFILIRPKDSQFLATYAFIDTEDLINICNGLLIIGYSFSKLSTSLSLLHIITGIILFLSGHIILYSLVIFIQSLSFKSVKVDAARKLIWAIVDMSTYPTDIFRGIAKIIFMTIIPIGLLTTIPAQALIGIFEGKWIALSLISACMLFMLSRKFFLRGLKNYSSASS